MRPGSARGRWLRLFFGVAFLSFCVRAYPMPDNPPDGFVWEDCKECHAQMLRPRTWFSKLNAPAYYFSPEAFDASSSLDKGLTFYACPNCKVEVGKTADEYARTQIAEIAARHPPRRGTTKPGSPPGPFTTYSLTFAFDRPADGKRFVLMQVLIANRETDTLYIWLLRSPRAEWREIEAFEDVMLKSLQLDPKF